MQGKVVLVCTDEVRTWRQVSPPLAGAGNGVLQATTTERALELISSSAVDLVVFDWASTLAADPVLSAARGRIPVIGLAGEDRRAAIIDLVCQHGVLHVCCPRAGEGGALQHDPAELVTTAEKILRHDCFGLHKYLSGFGIELTQHVVVRAEERDVVVDRLTELVRSLGGGRRVVESVALVADELITNAIYNAPRDPDGTPRYAHRSRRDKITLDPTEYVRVECGSDGRTFGLAVIDSFGSLHPGTLRAGVHRCLTASDPIQQKAGGAGLGLYTALSQTNQLVINLEPGSRTEVIALWDLARRGRGAGAAAGSLHLFASDGSASARRVSSSDAGGLDGVPEPTVALSDSVRRDIGAALGDGALVTLAAARSRAHLAGGQEVEEAIISGEIDLEARAVEELTGKRRVIDLFALRKVLLLRRADRPGLDTILAKIRGCSSLAPGIESALTHLVNSWSAAALLCRVGGSLVPWTGAGDIESWEELSGTAIPLGADLVQTGSIPIMAGDEALSEESGWLGIRAARAGVSLGGLHLDTTARALGDLMIGPGIAGEGLALSLAVGPDIPFILFACRATSGSGDEPMHYELLHRELTRMCERIEDRASAAPVFETSWAMA
ncbi:MAG TPA: hypothetical protein VKZ63_00470 [Kofleriaceae bacterium]|nr:hypothetical protein [Kofleriaceae bacterium]